MLFVTGIGVPEGPVVLKDGSWLVVEMSPDRGCVTHISPDGKVVKRIKTAGMQPTNLAFGLSGSKRIYVTEVQSGRLEAFDVGCDGLPLFK